MQEWQVLLDLKDFKGLRERQESQADLVPQVHLVPEDCLACQEKMVKVAKMGSPEQVDLQGHQEKEGCLECLGSLDQKGIAVFRDWTVQKDQEAVLERKVNMVALVQWGRQDQWDQLDQGVRGDEKDHQGLLVCVELMA